MPNISDVPIDWANVNWPYVITLVLLVFVCTFIGTALSLKRTFLGCVLTAALFGTAFMFWTYYPHNLPLPRLEKATVPSGTTQRPWSSDDPARLRDPYR